MASPPPGYPVPDVKGYTTYPGGLAAPGLAAYPPQPAYDQQQQHFSHYGGPQPQYGQPTGFPGSNGYPGYADGGYPGQNAMIQQQPFSLQQGPYQQQQGPYQAPGQMVMSQQPAQQSGTAAGPCCACCAGIFACCAACCIVDTCCDLLFGEW